MCKILQAAEKALRFAAKYAILIIHYKTQKIKRSPRFSGKMR